MAHYTLSMTPLKRSAGRNAVAAAAYRAGAELVDQRSGVVHDYRRKLGVVHVELMAPEGITLDSPEALWNAAEAAETNKRGRPAREVLIALPCELDADQRLALAREMTADLVERYGVAAQLAVHAPDRGGDQRNHHAHILLTTRRYNHDGLGAKSQLEWSNTQLKAAGLPKAGDELKAMRARYAAMQNAALERANVAARVDHRSLADQGIDRVPQVHVSNYGTQMIRRGTPEHSERAMLNLEIIDTNREVQHLREQLDAERAIEEWAEITPDTPPVHALEVPEPAASPAVDAELDQARESARMDSQERVAQNIADRHQLQIRGERRALERAQARVDERSLASQRQALVTLLTNVVTAAEEMEAKRQAELEARRVAEEAEAERQVELMAAEQREWQTWISRPEVGSDGRIVGEFAVEESCRHSWEESQRIEAAECAEQEIREAIADAESAQAEMDALADEVATEFQERLERSQEAMSSRTAGASIAQRLLAVQAELRTVAEEHDRAQAAARQAALAVRTAQEDLDNIRGLLKRRERRVAQQRLDSAQEHHRVAEEAALEASGRYAALSRESDQLRERAASAADAVSSQSPHRVKPRTEGPSPAQDSPAQRQYQRRRRDDGPEPG